MALRPGLSILLCTVSCVYCASKMCSRFRYVLCAYWVCIIAFGALPFVSLLVATTVKRRQPGHDLVTHGQSTQTHRVAFEQLGSPFVTPLFWLVVAFFSTHLLTPSYWMKIAHHILPTFRSTRAASILASRRWTRPDAILLSRIRLCSFAGFYFIWFQVEDPRDDHISR